jgi:predicted  nucleic acid-binding Zn-ribbon protein
MLESKLKGLKKDFMFIGFLIIVSILIYNTVISYFSNDNNKYLIREVNRINSQIKTYQDENKKLSEKIVVYEKLLIKIDSSISVNESKIDKLKTSTNEKINSFKSYDAIMWEKFFAERYSKQSND